MGAEKQFVVFHLEGQRYGAPIDIVREVTYVTQITRLPNTPAYVEGVVDLRGEVIPVVSLRRRLGMADRCEGGNARLMILTLGERSAAVMVDGVDQVLNIQVDSILPPDAATTLPGQDYVSGVARSGGELVVMLDLLRLMAAA